MKKLILCLAVLPAVVFGDIQSAKIHLSKLMDKSLEKSMTLENGSKEYYTNAGYMEAILHCYTIVEINMEGTK